MADEKNFDLLDELAVATAREVYGREFKTVGEVAAHQLREFFETCDRTSKLLNEHFRNPEMNFDGGTSLKTPLVYPEAK